MTIVLENIRSGWNVGSVMRTCDALGADLILVGYTPQPVGATYNLIAKTAIGAEKTVSWCHFTHAQEVFDTYPDRIHLAIEISTTSHNIFEYLHTHPISNRKEFCLWFGNEIHGLHAHQYQQFSAELHLPMLGSKESLNVSSTVCAVGYLFLQQIQTLDKVS